MVRTVAPPATDRAMWRRLLARCHPDAGGDHELFLFAQAVRERIEGFPGGVPVGVSREPGPEAEDVARIPFPDGADFDELTDRAIRLKAPASYGRLLVLLADCDGDDLGPLLAEQQIGASYKRLCAIGHLAQFWEARRVRWYRIAESIPLSERHATHIYDKLLLEGR